MSTDDELDLIETGQYVTYRHLVNRPDRLSPGCVLCMQGRAMVLSLTLKCAQTCCYCPVPDSLRQRDFVCLNETVLDHPSDFETLHRYVERTGARGCGITGGDPLTVLPRAEAFIDAMKTRFGRDFYIHMYTWGRLATRKVVRRLEAAGLDELRFHLWSDSGFGRILPALETSLTVGIEIPADPRRMREMRQIIDFARQHERIRFVNLNQMEFHPQSYERMRLHGFKLPPRRKSGVVRRSLSAARRIMELAGQAVAVHICPAVAKKSYQVVNRYRSEAFATLQPHERVSQQGLIVKGVVLLDADSRELEPRRSWGRKVVIDRRRRTAECSVDLLSEVVEWSRGTARIAYCRPDVDRTVLREIGFHR